MFIKSLHIKGMLSFQDMSLEMRPLNVLIGPNASGKSNLIEIIALLQSLPRDLSGFINANGGIQRMAVEGRQANMVYCQVTGVQIGSRSIAIPADN